MKIPFYHTKVTFVLFFYFIGSYTMIGTEKELVEKYLKQYAKIAYEQQDVALYYLEQAKHAAIEDPNDLIKVYLKTSDHYVFVKKDLEKALSYLAKAKRKATEITDNLVIAKIYNRTGYILKMKGAIKEAITAYKQAIEILESVQNDEVLNNSYVKFGRVLIELGLYEEAAEYLQKALNLANANSKISKSFIYRSLARLHRKKLEYEEAEIYLQKALKIVQQRKNSKKKEVETILITTQIAKVYYHTKRYEEALTLALANEKQIKKIKKKKKIAGVHLLLGQIYYELNQDELALKYAKKSYQKTKDVGLTNIRLHATKLLSDIYDRTGNHKKALAFSKEYLALNKESINAKLQKEFLREKYLNSIQEKDKKIELAVQKTALKNLQITVTISVSLATVLIGFIFHKRRKKILLKRIEKSTIVTKQIENKFHKERKKAAQIQHELDTYFRLRSNGTATEADHSTYQETIQKLYNLKILTEDDWRIFKSLFQNIHPDFFKNFKINVASYSMGDLKLATLIRLNFNTKEIAKTLAISPESVRKGKYRLRKKMTFASEKELQKFIYTL